MGNNSITDDDSFCNLYSTQRVTNTYNTLLEKLKSSGKRLNTSQLADKKDEGENGGAANKLPSKKKGKNKKRIEEIIIDDEVHPDPVAEEPIRFCRTTRSRVARSTRNPNPMYVLDEPMEACSMQVESVVKKSGNSRKNKSKESSRDLVPEVVVISDDQTDENVSNETIDDEVNYEVSVKVIWKSSGVKTFRLRRFQKFTKVFEHFIEEENIPIEKVFLSLNNRKITPNDTPESLNLQVYHFIDGGILSDSTHLPKRTVTNENCPTDKDSISVKIQESNKRVLKFSVNKSEPLKLIMMRYAEQIEVPLNKIKFYFDGEIIKYSDTPASLELDNDEIIDVKIIQ